MLSLQMNIGFISVGVIAFGVVSLLTPEGTFSTLQTVAGKRHSVIH